MENSFAKCLGARPKWLVGTAPDARMADYQRSRRIRLGHRGRRCHAALPWASHRCPARAGWPHDAVAASFRTNPPARRPERPLQRRRADRQSLGRRRAHKYLTEFRLETGLPVWHYQVGEIVLEKRVLLPHQQNTVFVIYRLIEGPDRIRLKLLPSVQFRPHDGPGEHAAARRAFAFQRGRPPRAIGGSATSQPCG